jgi:hypothetical protein
VGVTLGLLGGLAGIALGAWAGYAAGKRASGSSTWVYWALNALAFVIGLAVNVVGLTIGVFAIAMLGPGLIAGGITGLKFGYGRVVGPWVAVDSLTGGYAKEHEKADSSMADRSREVAPIAEPRTAAEAFGRPKKPPGHRAGDGS